MQQRPPQTQVRPHALLQAGDRDHLEFGADRRARRSDEDRVRGRLRGEGVFRHLGSEQFFDEHRRRALRVAFDEAPGGREQGDHAVEVAVRLVGDDPGSLGLLEPALREPAPLPRVPEKLLDRRACCAAGPSGVEGLGEPRRPPRRRGVDGHEATGRAHRFDQQLVGRPVAFAGEFLLAQGEPQPPEPDAIESAEGPEQEVGGDLRCHLDRTELDADERQQLSRRELIAERAPGDGGACRDLGDGECPCQGRDERPRPHHHGHLVPGHPAEEVVLPQSSCETRGLRGGG